MRCRPIRDRDEPGLVALFSVGFPDRSTAYWRRALALLRTYTARNNYPQAGYVVESEGEIVGALLMIYSRVPGTNRLRCNLSSWCLRPEHASLGPLLVVAATRDREVTYLNISPERATRPTVEAQGFQRYCDGLLIAAPMLARGSPGSIRVHADDVPPGVGASHDDIRLMQDHAGLDCLRLWCIDGDRAYPFIFVRTQRLRGLVGVAHVVYCPDFATLTRYGRSLGRFLLRRGMVGMSVDSNGPIPGLPGLYLPDRMPKYCKGPDQPRPGDLSYTELPFFGP